MVRNLFSKVSLLAVGIVMSMPIAAKASHEIFIDIDSLGSVWVEGEPGWATPFASTPFFLQGIFGGEEIVNTTYDITYENGGVRSVAEIEIGITVNTVDGESRFLLVTGADLGFPDTTAPGIYHGTLTTDFFNGILGNFPGASIELLTAPPCPDIILPEGFCADNPTDPCCLTGNFGTYLNPSTVLFERGDICHADYNADGVADFFDLLDFLDAWFANSFNADFNLSGFTDFFDLLDFLDAWFVGCP